jgi:outer membrane protein OmpA-like peptidoglycan-associated protein
MKTMLTKKLMAILFFVAVAGTVRAQDFLTIINDNYSGINQVGLQPASIADSRYVVDINIVGFNLDFKNDMFKFNSFSINALPWEYVDPNWWVDNTTLLDANGKAKNAIGLAQVMGPSFLVSMGHKHSLGFTSRFRFFLNADNIDEPLANEIYADTKNKEYWNEWHDGSNINIGNHVFAEYGITYARQVFDLGDHYMKAGGTIKLLQGIGAAYSSMESYDYLFEPKPGVQDSAKYLTWDSDYASIGISENWGEYNDEGDFTYSPKYAFIGTPSLGFDLGLVYEWRPNSEEYVYDMDGKTGLVRRDLNKYLIKVGVSVLDIGRIRYKNNPDNLQDFSVNNVRFDLDDMHFETPPYIDFADTIINRYGRGFTPLGEEEYFNMKLPTTLSFQLDVRAAKGFYINITTFNSLAKKDNLEGHSHYYSKYSLAPRYESKWFGVSAPLQYNQYGQFTLGTGFRLGPVYIGTDDILGILGLTKHFGNDLHFAIKIPIFNPGPPPDMDKDAVSDEKDKCPTVPGIWELQGCPDKDGDGVPDNEDLCPDDPGPKEYRGCPDRDGDGIIDKLDDCPSEPGLEQYNGCPDRDGDGIIDKLDQCPDEPGLPAFNGCPDTDGDGVPDKEDLCPTIPGLISMRGCPFTDTDGDGIKDEDDACPNDPGPIENRGCPYADTDGDGVLDKDDRCPLTPGDPQNFGCPILKQEEVEVLKTAFENLEFETAKAVIRSSSFPSLNELAGLMIKKPEFKLHIAGHTDNVGSDEYNMNLSRDRSQSVAKYLQGKGIDPKRFVVEWFGETRPIADNNTPEGRQKNRRVEMEVIFD